MEAANKVVQLPMSSAAKQEKKDRSRAPGEGTTYERGDGIWVAEVSRTVRGERKKTKLYAGSRAEVAKKLSDFKVASVDLDLDRRNARGDEPKIRLHLLPLLGDLKLAALTPAVVHARLDLARIYRIT